MRNKSNKKTAWKKNRRFGDIMGGRSRVKLKDGIVKRLHSLPVPANSDELPIFIVENTSRYYYFPISVDDVENELLNYSDEEISCITHIWLRKHNPKDKIQGYCVKGSGVCAVVIYPLAIDRKIRLGKERPSPRVMKWYKGYADVRMDKDGWVAKFTEDSAHRYYLERLLPHEIAHCIAYNKGTMRHSAYRYENYADNFAYNHQGIEKGTSNEN